MAILPVPEALIAKAAEAAAPAEAIAEAAAVNQAVHGDLLLGIADFQGIGFAVLNGRYADNHGGKALPGRPGEQLCSRRVCQGDDRPRSLHAAGNQHCPLRGCGAEILRHAGCAQRDDRAARDDAFAVKIQRAVAAAFGAGYKDFAARDGQIAVGIDAVAVCVDQDAAAGNEDFIVGVWLKGAGEPLRAVAFLPVACRVQAVVGGCEVYIAARDFDALPLNALAAFADDDGAAGNNDVSVRVNAVVARGDLVRSA